MTNHPNTLALELSQRTGSVAMMNSDGEVESKNIDCNRRDEDDIFPAIDLIANNLKLFANEIELVVVSIGPGGFSGLRTSVAIAKMVALANNAKVVSVESAIVCVEHAAIGYGPFLVLSSVKDEHFWLSKVAKQKDRWQCESENVGVETLRSSMGGIQGVFADEFLPKDAKCIFEQEGIPIHRSSLDAIALLRIGVNLYKRGLCTDPAQLVPIYPREPEAVRKWKAKDTPK